MAPSSPPERRSAEQVAHDSSRLRSGAFVHLQSTPMTAARYTDPNEVLETEGGSITVAELLARCEVVEPGIVAIHHPPHATAHTFRVLVEGASELATPFKRFAILNDLTETKHRPRGEYLDAIVHAASTVSVHWANIWPSNAFVRTVARFVSARLLRPKKGEAVAFSFHDNRESALQAARAALRKAGGP
jgi:hypothetical protein